METLITMDPQTAISRYSAEHKNPNSKEYFLGFINLIINEYPTSTEEIRRLVHVSPATIKRWQSGKSSPPYSATRLAIMHDLTDALS
ncbi:hypothetical protein HN747_03610 [archaeon]|jgi:hypothetical protein|nr:hypothetical protein [archaeon]